MSDENIDDARIRPAAYTWLEDLGSINKKFGKKFF